MNKTLSVCVPFIVALLACSSEPEQQEASARPDQEDAREAAGDCMYTVDEVVPGWTAYKTTERVAVSGTFTGSVLSGAETADSLTEALSGLTVSIDPSRVDSQDPLRDSNIVEFFFASLRVQKSMGKCYRRRVMNNRVR